MKLYSFNNYSALMAVIAIQAARGRTTVIAMMSENSNNGQNGSNAQLKLDSFNKYEFCYYITSVIIADEYSHNDCDGDNSCNGDIGFLEIDDLNGFNCCNSQNFSNGYSQ